MGKGASARLGQRPRILLARRGRLITPVTGDAVLRVVRMGVHPAVTAGRRQPPPPPRRLRVLRAKSITARTEDAALPTVRTAGRVPATAGRALTRLIITTARIVFPRLRPRLGTRLVQLENCTTVIIRRAALRVVRMGAHPTATAVRRRPLQPLQPLRPPRPLQRLYRFRVLRAKSISAATAGAARFRAAASG